MSKLRPCPKCGADRPSFRAVYYPHRLFTRFYIKCWNCNYPGPKRFRLTWAVKAWNRRADYAVPKV
jgi:hypothetical protein